MVTVGKKTKKIIEMHDAGHSVSEIADHFGITERSVEKRITSFEKIQKGFYTPSNPNYKLSYIKPYEWTIEMLKEGFDKFLKEHGRLPTVFEIDDSPYLPSSRQLQRRFGGLSKLRQELGYGEVHFGKGSLRGESAKLTGKRGREAEIELEKLLIERFGELYTHSEKRFGNNGNRVDFVIYARDAVVGIDVFTIEDKRTIVKNIAVKIPKYATFPQNVPLYFVVWNAEITQEEIDQLLANMSKLQTLPHLRVVNPSNLLDILSTFEPLPVPATFRSVRNEQGSASYKGGQSKKHNI